MSLLCRSSRLQSAQTLSFLGSNSPSTTTSHGNNSLSNHTHSRTHLITHLCDQGVEVSSAWRRQRMSGRPWTWYDSSLLCTPTHTPTLPTVITLPAHPHQCTPTHTAQVNECGGTYACYWKMKHAFASLQDMYTRFKHTAVQQYFTPDLAVVEMRLREATKRHFADCAPHSP
jgi:hypothetical protein